MEIVDPREKELWKKVEPYLDGVHLREDAPEEVREADKELTKIALGIWIGCSSTVPSIERLVVFLYPFLRKRGIKT